jgi:hypothetical protein
VKTLLALSLAALAVPAVAQETQRTLSEPGSFSKVLSPDQVDTWTLDGQADETIFAHVSSEEFDPTLQLADGSGKIVAQADDEGSESRIAVRLPATGSYGIRVQAYEKRGGGSYDLEVHRFTAQPVRLEEPVASTAGRDGWVHLLLEGLTKGQILIPDLRPDVPFELLDPKGRTVEPWEGTVELEQGGPHYLSFQTSPGAGASALIHAATMRSLPEGSATGSLERRQMDLWSFSGTPGQFRSIEVDHDGPLAARLQYLPPGPAESRLGASDEPPPLRLLPVESKGSRLRYAALLGRSGLYRLSLLARGAVTYHIRSADPSVPLQIGANPASLEIGGAAFFTFDAPAGQMVQLDMASESFDPTLRLVDASGTLVQENDDGGPGLASRIRVLPRRAETYRVEAFSRGNGGGGPFTLTLALQPLPELALGQKVTGRLGDGGRDAWSFKGRAGQSVILYLRPEGFTPALAVDAPGGGVLESADRGDVLALKLPQDGGYTVWVQSRAGGGAYTLRLIDAD